LLLKVGLSEFDLRTTGAPEPAAPCGLVTPQAQWALTNVGDPGDGNPVRVAHLDTDMTRITQVRGVDGSKPFGCAPFVEVLPIRVATSLASLGRWASTKFFCRWHAR
jgi:hypothetical protein